jgi:hypothetical protein
VRATQKLLIHFHVFWRAAVFGLGAYAVIRVAIYFSREVGLLDWLR